MSFGTAWAKVLGSCRLLSRSSITSSLSGPYATRIIGLHQADSCLRNGGNFIDTTSSYQNEQSEAWIGEWMAECNCRDEVAIATKFTTWYKAYESHEAKDVIQADFGGMHTKALKHSPEASLKKLKTDYIDVLYLHWWDYSTSIPELMHTLNDDVKTGRILYLGISNAPAW
jgi:aryl-alcohol dehydrogenase-like predicted oxidoreductase